MILWERRSLKTPSPERVESARRGGARSGPGVFYKGPRDAFRGPARGFS